MAASTSGQVVARGVFPAKETATSAAEQPRTSNAAHGKARLAPSGLISGLSPKGAFVKTAVSFIRRTFQPDPGAVADSHTIRFHPASNCFRLRE
jgi:hypothetical protein